MMAPGALNPFVWSGRLGRSGFLVGLVACVLLAACANFVLNLAVRASPGMRVALLAIVLFTVYAIQVYSIKRCRDLRRSGWLSLLNVVPVANFFFTIYLLIAPRPQSISGGSQTFKLDSSPQFSPTIAAAGVLVCCALLSAGIADLFSNRTAPAQTAQPSSQQRGAERSTNSSVAEPPTSAQVPEFIKDLAYPRAMPYEKKPWIRCAYEFEQTLNERATMFIAQLDAQATRYGTEYTLLFSGTDRDHAYRQPVTCHVSRGGDLISFRRLNL